MDLAKLLCDQEEEIITEAANSAAKGRLKHYEIAGAECARERLTRLFDVLLYCVGSGNAVPMIRYAEEIARERYQSGFDLTEVQTAFNVLEAAIWRPVQTTMPPAMVGAALGRISTVLGMGKDALARTYVSLATAWRVPALDIDALATDERGSGRGRLRQRTATSLPG